MDLQTVFFCLEQDHRPLKDPSRLFESVVVVGLHPNCDIQALESQYIARKSEGSTGRLRSALQVSQNHSRVEPTLEPQVSYHPSFSCILFFLFLICKLLSIYTFIFRSYLCTLRTRNLQLNSRIFIPSASLEALRYFIQFRRKKFLS